MIKIELTKEHRGGPKSTTFSGRPEGESVRLALDLSKLDKGEDQVSISIPEDTTSFNPSFFMGLFFESVKKLGSVERFKNKYLLDLSNFSDDLKQYILEDFEDCFRRCSNELNKKTGIDL